MTKIIGLTCHYTGNHDNSVALLVDGKIIFAESEERISRVKHDRQFPILAIKHALKFGKINISDIDYFVSASPPTDLIKLIFNYIKGMRYTSYKEVFSWLQGRLISFKGDNVDLKSPNTYLEANLPKNKLFFISHYLAHAETAYSFSGMDECLVVAWDGYGLSEKGIPLCGSVYHGKDGNLTLLEEIPVYSSMALYYGAITMALGFKLNDGEGKTMGLAAYGKKSGAIREIAALFPYFNGKTWIPRKNWLEINGVSRSDYFKSTKTFKSFKSLIDKYGDKQVAYAAQEVLEIESEKYFRYLVKTYKFKNIAVAGGLFLNVKFNMRLLKNGVAQKLFIYPNPSDGGVAVGAAVAFYKHLGMKFKNDEIKSAALGCNFSKKELDATLKSFRRKITIKKFGTGIYKKAASDIVEGKVIGWFQGRGEWGPRALGQRSVLADPRKADTRERINKYLKQRDWFMPFAPVILEEYKDKVLKNGYGTSFMTLTDSVKREYLKKIPAAVHVDGTARSQIVVKEINSHYWQVVYEFFRLTGIPVLLNTSFNKHGLPVVHSPKEAVEHLLWGCIDELVIEDYLVTRK